MQPQNFHFGSAVRIEWEDSAHVDGWRKAHMLGWPGEPDIGTLVSVGFVVACDERAIMISTTVSDEDGYICPLSIPWSGVIAVEELKDVPVRRNKSASRRV